MIALRIEDVRAFTSRLFVREDFDSFLVREATITTYNSFSIDGHIRSGYYTREEREENGIGEFSSWKMLRPICFSLIRGKKLPGGFRIVLQMPADGTERFAARSGTGITREQIQGLYLNIRYEDGVLYCITGISLNVFTMDKMFEAEWDKAVKEFMRRHEIVCVQE